MKCTNCKRDVETVVHHCEHRWCAECYSNRLTGDSPATIKAQRIRDAERALLTAAELLEETGRGPMKSLPWTELSKLHRGRYCAFIDAVRALREAKQS